jgi:hypothetical protein
LDFVQLLRKPHPEVGSVYECLKQAFSKRRFCSYEENEQRLEETCGHGRDPRVLSGPLSLSGDLPRTLWTDDQFVVEQFIAVHQEEAAKVRESEPEKTPARARLKRYVNE